MIELSAEKSLFDVEVVATVGVTRIVRVEARGASHARIVAKDLVQAEQETSEWTSLGGETVVIHPENITGLITGMCPKEVV